MATIDEVAKAAGVSISTVSYALSGKRSIKPDTRDRILKAAAELGYAPHASARMLAANRSHILAVTAPLHADTEIPAHMTFALEVTKSARDRGFDTLLLVDDDGLQGMQRTVATSLTDGIVVLDVDTHDPRADLARRLGHPTVFIGIPEDPTGLLCVDLDFEAAARQAVDALVKAGHRAIGLITNDRSTMERGANFPHRFLRAFEEHAESLGIEFAVTVPSGTSADEPIADLFGLLPQMTAIVANASARVTRGLTAALERRGLSVPRDISVISAGGTFDTGQLDVPLDKIPIDPQASCSTAVELLVEGIEAGEITPQVVLIPPHHTSFGSVARPPAARVQGA